MRLPVSVTPSNTPTNTPSNTPDSSPCVPLSQTPTPSITPTITPTISITPTITPTNTITPTVTSTATPTVTPSTGIVEMEFYLANEFTCVDCSQTASNVVVAFPVGTLVTIGYFYNDEFVSGFVYEILSMTTGPSTVNCILPGQATCAAACSV